MTLSDLARSAILACPGHWTPATLARQLRVDVRHLEPVLAAMPDLVRGTWRGELTLPRQSRDTRRAAVRARRDEQARALLRARALTQHDLARAIGASDRETHYVLCRLGATILHLGGDGTLWGVEGTPAPVVRPPPPAQPRTSTPVLHERVRDLLAERPRTLAEVAALVGVKPRHACNLLHRLGARNSGYGQPWRLP